MYNLNFDWLDNGQQKVEDLSMCLLAYDNPALPGAPLSPIMNGKGRFRFESLSPAPYLLSVQYRHQDLHFDSFYFLLDLPDITQIEVALEPSGALRFESMGSLNDYGEFDDMLVYEDEKPLLTHSLEHTPYYQSLTDYLVYKLPQNTAQSNRDKLSRLLADLKQSFGILEYLWPYQLQSLLEPELLQETSTAWKVILMHYLRNNLVLMDNETLHGYILSALEASGEQALFGEWLSLLDWNHETGTWRNLPEFLNRIEGQRMLR